MPVFNPPTLTRLLASIEAGNLVVLCGAGLSMPPPSNLMSAVSVARTCYSAWLPFEELPVHMRDDIDALAGHFHHAGMFKTVFLRKLVPWSDLVGEPNKAHAAVADLLVCRAAHAAPSANFDPLIEQWAELRKIAMLGAPRGWRRLNLRAT